MVINVDSLYIGEGIFNFKHFKKISNLFLKIGLEVWALSASQRVAERTGDDRGGLDL